MGVQPLRDEDEQLKAVVERALSEGPLTLTRDGVPAAVVVPAADYRRLGEGERPTLIEHLLQSPPSGGVDLDEHLPPRAPSSGKRFPTFD